MGAGISTNPIQSNTPDKREIVLNQSRHMMITRVESIENNDILRIRLENALCNTNPVEKIVYGSSSDKVVVIFKDEVNSKFLENMLGRNPHRYKFEAIMAPTIVQVLDIPKGYKFLCTVNLYLNNEKKSGGSRNADFYETPDPNRGYCLIDLKCPKGFSSSDAAGCSIDACGCSALSSSDTGGILSSGGVCSDSIPFSVDTFSTIGMTSNCASGLGVNDHINCNLTGNNAYYHACFQNSMQSENINECATQVHSSYNTDPIPACLFLPYLTTSKDVTLDYYLNKVGHVEAWSKNIPLNKNEDKELMFWRSKIAQMQIILASSKGDEYKKSALKAQIRDLTSQMERQENRIYAITKYQEQKHVPEITKVKVPESNPRKDTDSVQNRRKAFRIMCYWIIIAMVIAIALGVGLGVAQSQRK